MKQYVDGIHLNNLTQARYSYNLMQNNKSMNDSDGYGSNKFKVRKLCAGNSI